MLVYVNVNDQLDFEIALKVDPGCTLGNANAPVSILIVLTTVVGDSLKFLHESEFRRKSEKMQKRLKHRDCNSLANTS